MTPTAEQQAVIDAARSTTDNLIIHALAGAAKTSTLVLIAKALPSTPMLCLAFNKKIQLEMKERLPGNCEPMTLNSIGHRTWMKAIGRRLVIQPDKTYTIVKGLIDKLDGEDKSLAFEIMSDVMQAVNAGKTAGWIPDGKFPTGRPLLNDEEFFATLEEEPSALAEHLIKKASFESIAQAMQGTLDYNDQILMPTVFHGNFPSYPLTLADEAQDFSELNHVMLKKIVKGNRLIAVGDENQSIYAFRGAHEHSMALLQEQFNMKPFTLSISFRCPIEVVKEARFRAPHMQWPEWAKPGAVLRYDKWGVEEVPHNATIICRNNAPLFRMAIRLLKNSRFPELLGNDIGGKLIKTMKKLGPGTATQEEALLLLEQWTDEKMKKSRNKGSIADQAECMRVFLEQNETLGDAIAYANHIISASGTIKMMTCHKAKGLEWDHVFILDKDLIRIEKHVQERNLLYVAQTRAKEVLYYVETDTFVSI